MEDDGDLTRNDTFTLLAGVDLFLWMRLLMLLLAVVTVGLAVARI